MSKARSHLRRVPPVAGPTATVLLLAAIGCQDAERLTAPEAPPASMATSAGEGVQSIMGTVSENKMPLDGIHVSFLDALNAELLGDVVTMDDGTYDSGLLPIGSYRIRFSDPDFVGAPGVYIPEYSGAGGLDAFCVGSIVTLPSSSSPIVDEDLLHSDPTKVVLVSGTVSGMVLDAETGEPIPGIEVTLREAENATPVAVTNTDTDGGWGFKLADVRISAVRVRFADPTAGYLPGYFGTSGADLFCDASIVNFANQDLGGIDGLLHRAPPTQMTDALIEAVHDLDAPDNVKTTLATPLTQLIMLLSDPNADNDAAACGQLKAFVSRVNVLERRGELSAAEADALRAQTDNLQVTLGCI